MQVFKFIYYKQRCHLHVSGTYCERIQGDVLWSVYYIYLSNISFKDSSKNIYLVNVSFKESFKEHLPENV